MIPSLAGRYDNYRTGPPDYIGWRNRSHGILGSLNVYKCKVKYTDFYKQTVGCSSPIQRHKKLDFYSEREVDRAKLIIYLLAKITKSSNVLCSDRAKLLAFLNS